jgi:hypothetical protein
MKHLLRLSIISLCIFNTLHPITPTPYLALRSQGQHATDDLIGLVTQINKESDDFYTAFAVTPKYMQSFFENRIADSLFGNDLATDTLSAISVTGSGVKDRNATGKDWLADYFGLPRDHNGTMRFEPIISNYVNDLYCYLGLNNIAQGLFATVHVPIVHTKWDLNFFEVINTDGITFYPPGYFSPTASAQFTGTNTEAIGIPRADLLDNISDFLFWQETPDIDPAIFIPLQAARMVPKGICGHRKKSGVADIQAVLGWNFIQKQWCHLGLGLRTVIPTGTRPNGQFLFEPTIGNGHHWELGAQLWGHRTLCVSENEEEFWTVYFLLQVMHMFNAQQCRTFDLTCKPNSRWMLAEKFTSPVQNLRANEIPNDLSPAQLITPNAQFAGIFSPVANLSTRTVHVSSNIQCDGVCMLTRIKRHLSIDFGYNAWYRSCEKISKANCTQTPLTHELWALKGDSYVYGFTRADGVPPVPDNTPVALSATQSNATIHGGTNNFVGLNGNNGGINGIRPTRNPGVDNAAFAAAVFNGTPVFLDDRITTGTLIDAEQTETSLNPVFIHEDQLDLCNAATKGFSSTLFFHLSYWFDTTNPCYTPFFGFGFSFEIGNKNVPQDRTLQGCQNCALSQAAVWLRGGFSFN